MKKRLCDIFILIALVLFFVQSVNAAVDLSHNDGVITVIIRYDKTLLDGIKVDLYRVADVSGTDFPLHYTPVPALATAIPTLDFNTTNFETPSANKNLSEQILEQTKKVLTPINATPLVTNTSGIVEFTGLAPGLYLLIQADESDSSYIMSPVLMTIPYYGVRPNTDPEERYWSFVLKVYPKCEPKDTTPTPTPSQSSTPQRSRTPTRSSGGGGGGRTSSPGRTPSITPTPSGTPGRTPTGTRTPSGTRTPPPGSATRTPRRSSTPTRTPPEVIDIVDTPPPAGPIDIVDTPPPAGPVDKLPKTGLLTWPVPVLFFSGLLLFTTGIMIVKRSKVAYH